MSLNLAYPICRAALVCPLCGHAKTQGMLMCWRCHRSGKLIPNFGTVALDRFEHNPQRIAAFTAGEHE